MAIFDCNKASAADVNATQLSTAKVCEPVSGTVWQKEQPNEITSFQADYTSVARNPISMDRAARKGTITDVEVAPGFQTDLTIGTAEYWIPPFLYSKWSGFKEMTGNIASGTIELDTPLVLPFEVIAKVNGQLKTISTDWAVTGIEDGPVTVLIVGAKPTISFTVATGNLTITGNTFDIPLNSKLFIAGQGFVRVREKLSATEYIVDQFDIDQEIVDTTVDMYFSSFVSTVAQDSPLYEATQLTFEARFNTDPVTYQYARAVQANQMTVNAPLSDKATVDMTFIADELQTSDSALPGLERVGYTLNEALNTVTNISRVRIDGVDEKGLSTYMKDVTLTINNNAAGEKTLGNVGNTFTSLGDLEVTMNTETVMTDARVLQAIENNATVSFTLACKNNDGAVIFDIPTATISNGAKTLNRGEKVKIGTDLTGFLDDKFGYVLGVSLFNYLP